MLLLLCAWPEASAGQALSAGTVVVWGYHGSSETVPAAAQSGVTAIAAGGFAFEGESHFVALKSDGSVVAWGANSAGQATVPAGLSGVTAIEAAWGNAVALIGTAPLPPHLAVKPSGNALVLIWPTNAVGFGLQSTPDLTPPTTWMDSTVQPAIIGGQFTVTNPTSGSRLFYRLNKP